MSRLLLTGGGGFSGCFYAEKFAQAGHNLVVHAGRSRGRLAADFDSRTGSTILTGELSDLQWDGPLDAIIHAGATSIAPGISDEDMVRANVDGTWRVAELAKMSGARTVIYFSSLSVYGDIAGPTVNEQTPFVNPDMYGITKYQGEQALADAGEAFGSLSIRLPGVLGPGAVRNFLAGVKDKAVAGDPIRFFGADNPFNNAAHLADLADFALHLIEFGIDGHDAVVVGAAGQTTVGRAVEIIVEAQGSRSSVEILPPGDRPVFLIDDARARDKYGYDPMDIEKMILQFAGE